MRHAHLIPAVLEPLDTLCVKVMIPAHPDYVKLFVNNMRYLETDWMYQRDENLSALIVRDQWRTRTITPLIEELANTTGFCQDLDGDCITYAPFANFIQFTPQNPYTEPNLIPDGYLQPPFFINGKDFAHDLPQYNRGDVLLDIGSISLETGIELENAPQVDLCLEGSGTVEIHLLSIALGGVAIITVDNPPDILDIIGGIIADNLLIVDLNQDVVSFPPETAKVIIQEIEVNPEQDELEHHLYITYLPNIDDSLIPIRFGGGLRKVELCGTLRPCGQAERDINMATVEEICEAVICALEKSASRFLSGTAGNVLGDVKIDPENNITITPPGSPPDDPTTNLDNEKRAGGAIAVFHGFRDMILEINSWILDGVPVSEMNFWLGSKYAINGDMLAAITAYAADFTTPPLDWTVPVITSVLAEKIYCDGNRRNVIAAYILETWDAEIGDLLAINNGLEQSQLEEWFADGENTPSTDYLAYSCTPIADFEVVIQWGVTLNDTHVLKKNHRYEFIVSGYLSDPDGDLQDAWWHKPSGGNQVFDLVDFNIQIGGSLKAEPTQFEVPYQGNHTYRWTVDMGANDASGQYTINRDAIMAIGSTSPTGGLTISVHDLGEID